MNAAAPDKQTINPERQIAAAEVAAVFNSLHAYLSTLQFKDETGQALTTQQLEWSRKSVEEASLWAIKHVLFFGVPPKAAAPTPPADTAPVVVDPPAPPGPAANDTADAENDKAPEPDHGVLVLDLPTPAGPPSLDDIENKQPGDDPTAPAPDVTAAVIDSPQPPLSDAPAPSTAD